MKTDRIYALQVLKLFKINLTHRLSGNYVKLTVVYLDGSFLLYILDYIMYVKYKY